MLTAKEPINCGWTIGLFHGTLIFQLVKGQVLSEIIRVFHYEMLKLNILLLLICILCQLDSFEAFGVKQQWIRVSNETACGECPLDHQCFRPLK